MAHQDVIAEARAGRALTPRQLRETLPFDPVRVGTGTGRGATGQSGWANGVVAERYEAIPACDLVLGPETHHRLVLLTSQSGVVGGGKKGTKELPRIRWGVEDAIEERPVGLGGLCIAPAGSTHVWGWEHGTIDSFSLLLPPALVERCCDEQGVKGGVGELLHHAHLQDPCLAALLGQLSQELARPCAASSLLVEALTTAAGVHLARDAGTPAPAAPPRRRVQPLSDRAVADVRAYVAEHLDRNVELKELADAAGCGAGQFGRRFKRSTGRTPHQDALRVRVGCAEELLKAAPELTTEAIAVRCGFAGHAHLSRTMSRLLDLRPSDVRKAFHRPNQLRVPHNSH